MAESVLEAARGLAAAGLSVIPVRADGSKAPMFDGWRQYAEEQADDRTLSGWFGGSRAAGIGVACGAASGNLAVLDFETAQAWEGWVDTINLSPGLLLPAESCPLCRPPGGGAHLYARLPDTVPGTVLARRVAVGGRPKTLIEVRGAGHQVVAPGSPAECHPSGRPYRWLRRAWVEAGTPWEPVPFDVWFSWLEAAAALNEWTKPAEPEPPAQPRDRSPSEDDPGRDFNRRGTWEEAALFSSGWAWQRRLGAEAGMVRRPGKADGTGGTVGLVTSRENGWPLFYCFSTNAHPFESGQCYDRFGVLTRLRFGGDFGECAKALLAAGYGRRAAKQAAAGAKYEERQAATLLAKVNDLAMRVRRIETQLKGKGGK